MNLNNLIQTVRTGKPPRIVLHGVHGVGKSTWASNAPDPIFIITEDGLTSIDVPHFPLITDLDQVWEYMGLLIDEDNPYKTFVLDTADWLEKIIWAHICKEANVDNIESFGFGKGYTIAMKQWDRLYRGLELLRDKGMATVILAHNEIKAYNPPDADPFDRYQIKLHKHAATKLEEWADVVLFANFQVYVDTEKGAKKGKAARGEAQRVIYTTNCPAWKAKTRYALPDTLKMDFNELLGGIKNG